MAKSQNNHITKADYYSPALKLSISEIRKDLTRGVGVTILALICEISLYLYLQNGGWQSVLNILENIRL